tara:strand:- start:405 stop:1235 length:831 start_codon:yes stop_codon:yes gene_type:complete
MDQNAVTQELQQLQGIYLLITEFLVQYSFKILGAIIIFMLGMWIASKVAKLVARQFAKHGIDISLSNFVCNFTRILIIIMVGIIAMGKLGISITPMVAAIGAASLGLGLAIQGMLSNYAAGITIIVSKPFVVGNTISIQGVAGVVKEIFLGRTLLSNEEGEEITIPNKHIVGEILHNSFANKLVETHFNIHYHTDTEAVIKSIEQVLKTSAKVYQDKGSQVGINDFNSIGIEIGVRYWVPTNTYYQDKFETNLAVYKALKSQGVEIARPKAIHIEP